MESFVAAENAYIVPEYWGPGPPFSSPNFYFPMAISNQSCETSAGELKPLTGQTRSRGLVSQFPQIAHSDNRSIPLNEWKTSSFAGFWYGFQPSPVRKFAESPQQPALDPAAYSLHDCWGGFQRFGEIQDDKRAEGTKEKLTVSPIETAFPSALASIPGPRTCWAIPEETETEPAISGWPQRTKTDFRYLMSLYAPSMLSIRHGPRKVAYLDEGRMYNLTLSDSLLSSATVPKQMTYRIHVRLEFDNNEHRLNPAGAWQLWKTVRCQRKKERFSSNTKAIELADINEHPDQGNSHLELEKHHVDGFSVIWKILSEKPHTVCNIPLRFNFLSTDFTSSTGAGGLPVRLYVKIEHIKHPNTIGFEECDSETRYCIIKLFRSHGAERKLFNEASYARKRLGILQTRIRLAERIQLGRTQVSKTDWNFGIKFHRRPLPPSTSKAPSLQALRSQLMLVDRMLSSRRPEIELNLYGDHDVNPSHGILPLDLNELTRYGKGLENANSSPQCHPPKAIACFFVQFLRNNELMDRYHHAFYLRKRTEIELRSLFANFSQISFTTTRMVWLNSKGTKILVDDDFVRQIPEAQAMTAETTIVNSPRNSLMENEMASYVVYLRPQN